jgi:hypothetical protein
MAVPEAVHMADPEVGDFQAQFSISPYDINIVMSTAQWGLLGYAFDPSEDDDAKAIRTKLYDGLAGPIRRSAFELRLFIDEHARACRTINIIVEQNGVGTDNYHNVCLLIEVFAFFIDAFTI